MSVKYVTRDTAEAAFYWALPDFDLIGEHVDGRTVYFHLEARLLQEEDLAAIQRDWRNDRVSINPKVYYGKLQELRQIINNAKFRK